MGSHEEPAYYHIDRVAPWLLIGPALRDRDYPRLKEHGVTHVVDLREEGADDESLMRSLGFHWRRLPIPDRAAPTLEQIDELVRWLDASPADQETLYLHCEGGMGRTPTVAIALLLRQGFALPEALRLVQSARAESSPTRRQLAWLQRIAAHPPWGPDPPTGPSGQRRGRAG